jgi:hypothetical protein
VEPVTWRDVLMCGHHYVAHRAAVDASEFVVFDERAQLDVRLDASA